MIQVYVDCDGVLADFDKTGEALFGMPPRKYEAKVGTQEFWRQFEAHGNFFGVLDKMPNADKLMSSIKNYYPIILTGVPRGTWAQEQKLRWRDEHFPGVPMVVCSASEKSKWCKPGDILIDDRDKYKLKWEMAGGFYHVYEDEKWTDAINFIIKNMRF